MNEFYKYLLISISFFLSLFIAYYLNDCNESKKRILQEIGNLQKDSDRDVRDNVISASSDYDKTDSLSCEIPPEILATSSSPPPMAASSPQIEIIETPPPLQDDGDVTAQESSSSSDA